VAEPFVFRDHDGVGCWHVPALEALGCVAAFSSRLGGVSSGETATLNLSYKKADTPERVRENYRRLARALELPLESFNISRQVHGTEVLTAAYPGRGILDDLDNPICDAWITQGPGMTLVKHHGDCTPVWLVDPVHQALGLIHAGWRGTVTGTADACLKAMTEHYGTNPANVFAAVGPSIGSCCFEIQADVAEPLATLDESLVQHRDGKMFGDLRRANALRLLRLGVPTEQIFVTELCTACHPEAFYSHRRDHGHTGTMVSVLAWKKP